MMNVDGESDTESDIVDDSADSIVGFQLTLTEQTAKEEDSSLTLNTT